MKTAAIEKPAFALNDSLGRPGNIVEMPRLIVPDRRARVHRPQPRHRFKISTFTNRGGSDSWRVSGVTRTGERIRENFHDAASARCRQTELEAEYLARPGESTALRATRLSEVQARIAETVFPLLERDDDLLTAVQFWREHRHKHATTDAPRVDDAVKQFTEWLNTPACDMRDHSRRNLRIRLNIFGNSVANVKLSEVTPEFLEAYLDKRTVSAATKDNDKRAVSRFFSWCIERPRRWVVTNPAREVRVNKGEKQPPQILSVDQCKALLGAAEDHREGLLAPFVAVCLFAGLRPFEASRLTRQQVNLTDKEIRLEATQTKTGKPRTVTMEATLAKWLTTYKGEFFPTGWRKNFDTVKRAAGLEKWEPDLLRHTAISHFFRHCGSYGKAAEQFGNSEAIIKAHYQGRVNSADTAKFYGIKPKKR